MAKCTHRHKKFIAVTDYRGYPEKIYSCQDCGMMITDFASDAELVDYKKLSKKPENSSMPSKEIGNSEKRVS